MVCGNVRSKSANPPPSSWRSSGLRSIHAPGRFDPTPSNPSPVPGGTSRTQSSALKGVHRDFRIRLAVIGALQGDRALPGLSDDDWRVRVAAVRRIRSVSLLERAARDESVDVRCACARALGRIGGKGVAPLLKKLLASEHATVRHRAVGALLRVAIPDRSGLLLSAATLDASRQVRPVSSPRR